MMSLNLLLFCLTLMSSCAEELILCEVTELGHRSPFTIEFDWSQSVVVPDTMEIVAYRPYHMTKYHYSAVPQTDAIWRLDSLIEWQKPMGVSDDSVPEYLRSGDYWVTAIYQSKPYIQLEENDTTNIESEFLMKYTYSFNKAFQNPADSAPKYTKWVDFNPEYPYFYDEGTGCFDQVPACSDGQQLLLHFTPKPFSQCVTVKFDLQLADEDIYVDSIQAEISGVARSKQLLSGYLDTDVTASGKVLFSPNLIVSGQDQHLIHASSRVYGLGFLSPVYSDMKTGPGIINMAIYTRFREPSGVMKQRTIFAGINLFEVYRQHPLTQISEDGAHRIVSSMVDEIIIETPIVIYGKDFVEDNNKENGVEIWQLITDDYTDMEI